MRTPPDPLAAACRKAVVQYRAREIRLRFLLRPSTLRWIATALLEYHLVGQRMRAQGIRYHGSDDVLNFYSDQPVARGNGKTAIEAVNALQTLEWRSA